MKVIWMVFLLVLAVVAYSLLRIQWKPRITQMDAKGSIFARISAVRRSAYHGGDRLEWGTGVGRSRRR